MRYKLLLPVMAFMLSCNFITGLGSGSTEGSVDYDAPADPLNVSVVLNEADSVSGMIPPEGGKLTLSSADGSVYTLEVPGGALDVETEIVMTSVQSIEGTATGDGLFAVQLEPSGLRFNELVTLFITPAMNVSREDLVFIKYEGNGEDVHLALVDPFTEEIDVLLLDFSGIGYGVQSVLGSIVNGKIINSKVEQALGEASQKLAKEKTSAGKTKYKKQINNILDEYKKKEVDTLLKAAQNDCNKVFESEDALNRLEAYRKKYSPDNPNPPGDKKARETLKKAKDKCPKAYNAEGDIAGLKITGVICNIENFTLSFPGPDACTSEITFRGGLKGFASYNLDCGFPVKGSYKGTYTLSLDADGKTGTIAGSLTGNMEASIAGSGPTTSLPLNLKLTETLKCY